MSRLLNLVSSKIKVGWSCGISLENNKFSLASWLRRKEETAAEAHSSSENTIKRVWADNKLNLDGKPNLLQWFLTPSENLLQTFQDRTNPNALININLQIYIFFELKGTYSCRTNLYNIWIKQLGISKNNLIHFLIKETLNVSQDLLSLKPKKNGTLISK